ncbi:MAG: condensation domain-containing protein, partial [Hyalangium sp.]|uniref:condensation domain-containing protein n=1 Tax=Hyalangium sp. TaxID=2028555 RepID=UPI003899CEA5
MSSDVLKRLASLPADKREQLMRQLREKAARTQQPAIPTLPRDAAAYPLSFAQQRLWFMDQLEPGSPAYNIPAAVRMVGTLDVAALERSASELVRRHESLRTTFRQEQEGPVQVIGPATPVTVSVVDLGHLPEGSRDEEALRLAREEALRPFDLIRGPLFRATLLKLSPQEHILLLTMHHIVSDGWSMGVFIREVATLYDAQLSGRPSPLSEPGLQYVDYAAWQRGWLQGEVLDTQLGFWRRQLTGAPPVLELPTDRPRPAMQSFRGSTVPVRLSKEASEALKALCQKENATPFMALLAGWQVVLSRYSGQDDISVATPIAGRNRGALEGLIGVFINTLVLRARVDGTLSFRQLLGQVRETTLGAYAHQDLPFEKLVDALQPERNLSHTPLAQVMIALQNAPVGAVSLPGVVLRPLELEGTTAKFDLSLTLGESEQGFGGVLEYATDLFDASTVTRLAGHVQTLLEALVARPDAPLATLSLLSDSERNLLSRGWNDTAYEYPRESCIHDVFARQAALRPDAIALESSDQRLTYCQLDERANQWAHLLRRHGVGPDSRVALCLERSVELIVSLLGILKAGGCYVPLDASYPRERLVHML